MSEGLARLAVETARSRSECRFKDPDFGVARPLIPPFGVIANAEGRTS